MRAGMLYIALLTGLTTSASGATATTSDGDKRLVIVESPDNRLSKDAKEHLRAAIGDVVVSHGLHAVPLPGRWLRCDLPGCLPQLAAATGATLVLQVEARYAKESFKLAIELWNSDEGTLLGREERDCPICDEQDLWGSAALLVQGLLDRALRETKTTAVVAPPPSSPALAPPPQPPVTAVERPADQSRTWAGYAGAPLVVAGAALLGAGIYYMAVDGTSACERCDWLRDTMKDGRRLAIGGGATLAVGVGLLLWRFWPSAPAVALGPSGLAVAGRFQ